jgi:hypothetical protein
MPQYWQDSYKSPYYLIFTFFIDILEREESSLDYMCLGGHSCSLSLGFPHSAQD